MPIFKINKIIMMPHAITKCYYFFISNNTTINSDCHLINEPHMETGSLVPPQDLSIDPLTPTHPNFTSPQRQDIKHTSIYNTHTYNSIVYIIILQFKQYVLYSTQYTQYIYCNMRTLYKLIIITQCKYKSNLVCSV